MKTKIFLASLIIFFSATAHAYSSAYCTAPNSRIVYNYTCCSNPYWKSDLWLGVPTNTSPLDDCGTVGAYFSKKCNTGIEVYAATNHRNINEVCYQNGMRPPHFYNWPQLQT